MITDRQLAAARRHPWLQAVYYHDDIVQQILKAPDVASDRGIAMPAVPRSEEIDSPDAKIDVDAVVDVIPDTPVSRQGHLARPGIDDRQQLITYPPAAESRLRDIFQAENSSR